MQRSFGPKKPKICEMHEVGSKERSITSFLSWRGRKRKRRGEPNEGGLKQSSESNKQLNFSLPSTERTHNEVRYFNDVAFGGGGCESFFLVMMMTLFFCLMKFNYSLFCIQYIASMMMTMGASCCWVLVGSWLLLFVRKQTGECRWRGLV